MGLRQQQRALAKVIEHQRRQRNREPRELNCGVTEMAEVGIQCFTARHSEEYRAQHDQSSTRIFREKADGMGRENGAHDRGVTQNAVETEHGNRGEPDEHDRTEDAAHHGRPAALKCEQTDEDDECDPQDPVLQLRCGDLETFDRRQHGDRRGERTIGIQQRRPENAQHDHDPARRQPAGDPAAVHERHECQHPAFTFVIGSNDHHVILDRDDQDQGPKDEREHPKHVPAGDRNTVWSMERLAHRIEGARPDVAIDDAEGEERQTGEIVPTLPGCRSVRWWG